MFTGDREMEMVLICMSEFYKPSLVSPDLVCSSTVEIHQLEGFDPV